MKLIGRFNGLTQAVCEFSLLFNASQDFLLAFADIAQIGEPVCELAKLFVFERTCGFLAITGNKRNGVSRIQQISGSVYLLRPDFEFCSNQCGDIFFFYDDTPPFYMKIINLKLLTL